MTYACKLKNFSGEILENSCHVHGCLGANTHLVLGVLLQEALNTAARELEVEGIQG